MYKKIVLLLTITNACIHGMEEIPLRSSDATQNNDNSALNLSKNNLTSVDGCHTTLTSMNMLPVQYTRITKLILSNNTLKNVPDSFIPLFSNLQEFDISYNKLTNIDIGTYFRICPKLKYMNFSYNQINDATWSDHKSWHIEEDDTVTLPIINLIGNPIADNNNVCNALKERYRTILNQVCTKAYPYTGYEVIGSALGTSMGVFVGVFTADLAKMLCFIPPFAGCVLGTAGGIAYVKRNYNDDIKKRIEKIIIPIYFEQEPYDQDYKQFSFASSSGCNTYLCKYNYD